MTEIESGYTNCSLDRLGYCQYFHILPYPRQSAAKRSQAVCFWCAGDDSIFTSSFSPLLFVTSTGGEGSGSGGGGFKWAEQAGFAINNQSVIGIGESNIGSAGCCRCYCYNFAVLSPETTKK